MDNPRRLAFMGWRKFLLGKCPAECGEKFGAIVVTSLVPREPRKVTALPPSSGVVCLVSQSCVVMQVRLCLCVAAPLRALDHV